MNQQEIIINGHKYRICANGAVRPTKYICKVREPRITVSISVSAEIKAYLDKQGNRSKYIQRLINRDMEESITKMEEI